MPGKSAVHHSVRRLRHRPCLSVKGGRRHAPPAILQVGDIFTHYLLALDAKISKRTITVKLRHQLRRRRVIVGQVLRGPPFAEAALSIINTAEFVEAVD